MIKDLRNLLFGKEKEARGSWHGSSKLGILMKADNIDSDCCHYDTCVVQLMYCSHWLICWNKIETTNQPNNNFIGDTSSQEINVNCCGFFYDVFYVDQHVG